MTILDRMVVADTIADLRSELKVGNHLYAQLTDKKNDLDHEIVVLTRQRDAAVKALEEIIKRIRVTESAACALNDIEDIARAALDAARGAGPGPQERKGA